MVIKSTTRAPLPRRRFPHLPAVRQHAGAAHQRPPRRHLARQQSYLGRALGVNPQIEIDYQMLPLEQGDVFVLATDGVYEHLDARRIAELRQRRRRRSRRGGEGDRRAGVRARQRRQSHRPDRPHRRAARQRGERGVRPAERACRCRRCWSRGWCSTATASCASCTARAAATSISPSISRPMRASSLKIPSIDLRDDPAYLKRFLMEEWVARRIDSPHVLKPCAAVAASATSSTSSTEYIDGQTLTQWMIDNPTPVAGDGARHRRADRQGPARLSPQGDAAPGPAARQHHDRQDRHGEDHRFRLDPRSRAWRRPHRPACATTSSARCSTPRRNIFSASAATSRSDLFSLGVITYQMLTGKLPYGAKAAQARTRAQFGRLQYRPAAHGSARDPGLGRRHAGARRASQSGQTLRQPVGILVRPARTQCRITSRPRPRR